MSQPRKVHIVRPDGTWRYNRLYDDGGPILRFDSYGFVERREAERGGCRIVDGWLPTREEP